LRKILDTLLNITLFPAGIVMLIIIGCRLAGKQAERDMAEKFRNEQALKEAQQYLMEHR
jgi:hypothetical protein